MMVQVGNRTENSPMSMTVVDKKNNAFKLYLGEMDLFFHRPTWPVQWSICSGLFDSAEWHCTGRARVDTLCRCGLVKQSFFFFLQGRFLNRKFLFDRRQIGVWKQNANLAKWVNNCPPALTFIEKSYSGRILHFLPIIFHQEVCQTCHSCILACSLVFARFTRGHGMVTFGDHSQSLDTQLSATHRCLTI